MATLGKCKRDSASVRPVPAHIQLRVRLRVRRLRDDVSKQLLSGRDEALRGAEWRRYKTTAPGVCDSVSALRCNVGALWKSELI